MSKSQFRIQLLLFVLLLILILIIRTYISQQLIKNGINSYQTHSYLGISANMFMILLSYIFIRKNKLLEIGGLHGNFFNKWLLLIFPLVYLVLLNAIFTDKINTNSIFQNLLILLLYVLSVGFAEELSIRGFIQSHLIKFYGHSKKNIVLSILAASVFFGLLHLFKYDKGLYGELSQIFYATFIGIMFGTILVITQRIYPLIIIHAIIDFAAKIDLMGLPVTEKTIDPISFGNSLLIIMLVLPCLIYAIFLMRKKIYLK